MATRARPKFTIFLEGCRGDPSQMINLFPVYLISRDVVVKPHENNLGARRFSGEIVSPNFGRDSIDLLFLKLDYIFFN